MSEQELRQTLLEMFRAKPILKDISEDDDFFDLGASSLTVVDLQMDIESKIGVTVPTKVLMSRPTVNGWTEAYSEQLAS